MRRTRASLFTKSGDISNSFPARTSWSGCRRFILGGVAKRIADEYAEMSRAVEAGEYTAGPLEMFGGAADPTVGQIEQWLAAIKVDPADARGATHFRRIRAAVASNADEAELDAAVAAARDAGDSWAIIGAAIGLTAQAAEERYGN
jgi:hypothetical protein